VAVLGSGIDVDYPATNRHLLRSIAQRGTLVSEYPPGVPAEPFRFPARNRLIAGLSIGVVIVEGGARSGTRSTADYAVQLGLDVFAVPGRHEPAQRGAPRADPRRRAPDSRPADPLRPGVQALQVGAVSLDGLPAVEGGPRGAARTVLPDAVSRAAGLSIPDTVAALVRLEIRGLVQGNGGRYRRTFQLAAEAPGGTGEPDAEFEGGSGPPPSG
jgi:DNA processing protein